MESSEVVGDPGPMARLGAVVALPETPSVVFQRVCDGETLKEIAKAWGLPVGRFTEWVLMKHEGMYDAALKVRADQLAHEALERADGADAESVGPAKLQVDTRLKLAGKWDRARYGEVVKVDRTITVTADAGLVGFASALLEKLHAPRAERIIDASDDSGEI